MRPSIVLDLMRSAIREAAGRFRTANPRIFGSVLHGTDQEGSDLDLLVDALPGATLFDLGVNGDSKLIQISYGQRFKTDTPRTLHLR